MSTPSITSSSPATGATDVVLGTVIKVGFSAAMNTASITSSTFTVTGPGQTGVITPGNLISPKPQSPTGREYITGTFTFADDTNGHTVVTFTPSRPLRPNVAYTVLIVGTSTVGSGAGVTDSSGNALDNNYQWSFTTGDLNVVIPPPQSPLPSINVPLDPSQIRITERIYAVGNDLSQEITIQFPGPIDTSTITPEQVLLSLEPILNDPFVQVPSGLTPTVTIEGSTITITIAGWPSS